MNSDKIIGLINVAVLTVLFFCILHNMRAEQSAIEEVVTEKHSVDTLTIVKTDTIVRYEPKYITQNIIKHDTLYVTKDSIIYLPITQKFYSEKGNYDVWISGYNPQLDSIKTYRQREIVTIDHFVEKEIVRNKYELYLQGGINAIQREITPTIGVTLVTPKRFYYELDLGYYKGQMLYGAKFGFKLF